MNAVLRSYTYAGINLGLGVMIGNFINCKESPMYNEKESVVSFMVISPWIFGKGVIYGILWPYMLYRISSDIKHKNGARDFEKHFIPFSKY